MKNKYKLKYNEEQDLYKELADDSLMRLQLFINDILGCIETATVDKETLEYIKEFVKFYTNICINECKDNSLPKPMKKVIDDMLDGDEDFELILKAIVEVLSYLDLYNKGGKNGN